MVTLATERLLLRPFRHGDAAQFTRFAGEWAVASMTSDIPYPLTQTQAMAWLKPGRGEVRFAIELEGRLIAGADTTAGARALPNSASAGRPWWGRVTPPRRPRPLSATGFRRASCRGSPPRTSSTIGRRRACCASSGSARRRRLYHKRRARVRRRSRNLLAERPTGRMPPPRMKVVRDGGRSHMAWPSFRGSSLTHVRGSGRRHA